MKFNLGLMVSDSRKDARGRYPITISAYSSITKKNIVIRTGYYVPKSYWDKKNKKVSTAYPEAAYINGMIAVMLAEYKQAEMELAQSGIPFDLNDIRKKTEANKTQTQLSAKEERFVWAIEKWVEVFANTKTKNYVRAIERLKLYINEFDQELLTKNINTDFWIKFNSHLVNTRGLDNESINSIVKRIKTVVKYMAILGKEIDRSYELYNVKYVKKKKFALTSDELNKLVHFKTEDKTLDLVKDIFVFSCCTGFRIGDILAMTKDSIVNWEYISPASEQKTGKKRTVPLTRWSTEVVRKYYFVDKNAILIFPKISEQEINRSLKEIAKQCNLTRIIEKTNKSGANIKTERKHIWQKISMHIARHTFTTLILAHTKDIVLTKEAVGHESLETTMQYSHLGQGHIEAIKAVFGG